MALRKGAVEDLLQWLSQSAGESPAPTRKAALENAGLPSPLDGVVQKVALNAYRVTDADIRTLRDSGLSEDQIFEIFVCAAVGQSARQYSTAMAALDAVRER